MYNFYTSQKYGLFVVSFEMHNIRMHHTNQPSVTIAVFPHCMHLLEIKYYIWEPEAFKVDTDG